MNTLCLCFHAARCVPTLKIIYQSRYSSQINQSSNSFTEASSTGLVLAYTRLPGKANRYPSRMAFKSTCTVTKADVYAVLVSLEDVVKEAIQNGEIVRLGDLCTLQVGLSGKGTLTEEEYEDTLIKKARINFRPGPVLAGALTSLKFTKVPIKYVKEEKEENNDGFEE